MFTRHFALVAIISFSIINTGCEYDGNGFNTNDADIQVDSGIDTEITTPDAGIDTEIIGVDAGSPDTGISTDAGQIDTHTEADAGTDTGVAPMKVCADVAFVNNCMVIDLAGHMFYQTMFDWTCARCTGFTGHVSDGCVWEEDKNTLCVADCGVCPHMRSVQ